MIFNKLLKEGCFPLIWKKARLFLLRKGVKPLEVPLSYRPLCLLDCTGKLFEKIIDNRLREFLDLSGGIHDYQYGFHRGRSTTDVVPHLQSIIAGPQGKTEVLTLDIKNEFNSAPWSAILDAMRDKEVPGYLVRMIGSYISNRSIQFERNGITSVVDLSSGVPPCGTSSTTTSSKRLFLMVSHSLPLRMTWPWSPKVKKIMK